LGGNQRRTGGRKRGKARSPKLYYPPTQEEEVYSLKGQCSGIPGRGGERKTMRRENRGSARL